MTNKRKHPDDVLKQKAVLLDRFLMETEGFLRVMVHPENNMTEWGSWKAAELLVLLGDVRLGPKI